MPTVQIWEGPTFNFFCHVVHHLIVSHHFKFKYFHTPNVTNWLHFVPVEFCHSLIIFWLCQGKILLADSLKTQLSSIVTKYSAGSFLLVFVQLECDCRPSL